MRKANSTEATLSRKPVEMEADLKSGNPLEPKDLIDWTPGEKEITDPIETVEVILKLSDIEESPVKWFERQGLEVLTKEDGTVYLYEANADRMIKDIVRKCLGILYFGKYAYLKKGEYELYGQVDIKRYQRKLATPLGYITIPIITVDGTPVFFNSKWCLTEGERNTYELYNNKVVDYDQMELEKKIMADLILYSQLGNKTMDDSKTLFDKIKKECENVGTLKRISFDNGVFKLDFDWRMGFDTAHNVVPMVFPPFSITINFITKTLGLNGRHPHRYNGDFCLGGALTELKNKCFRDKDIYGLVMGMVQFAGEWNSNDVGHSERHPGACIIKTVEERGLGVLDDTPVSMSDILLTIMEYRVNSILDYPYWKNHCKNLINESEGFRKLFKERTNEEDRAMLLNDMYTEEEREQDLIKTLY